ncbi:MAG: TonB-dependent receptor [Bacteroidota bacterium]
MRTKILISVLFLFFSEIIFSQTITQELTGTVKDKVTREPLLFVNVVVQDSDPLKGTTTGMDGTFNLKDVPVGRHNIRVSMVGYEPFLINELLVTSGSQVPMEILLEPVTTELGGVVVKTRKDQPLNSMATLSSRQFTVEETERYAGGLDDPARLATSFAGVAAPSVSSNGISVRGNNPDGLLWQIEGVEVPNPNHFANLTVAGGGLLTALSNQVMANSDFYTGAFPAQYGNASSGVFDIKLRDGNTEASQYAFQAGIIGVDFTAEGPFQKEGKSNYLMNYRNSTMALLEPVLPDNTGILKYQDLAFKTNFQTRKAGKFTFWGIGALDGQEMAAADSADWKMDADRDNSDTRLYMFASALSHQLRLGEKTFLKTTLSATGNGLSHTENRVGVDLEEFPQSNADNNLWRYALQSDLDHHLTRGNSFRAGLKYSQLGYNIQIEQSEGEGEVLQTLSDGDGQTGLIQSYAQSKMNLVPRLTLNFGVNAQMFLLNDQLVVEPRAGMKYQLDASRSVALAYGQHSRIEQLPVYFVEIGGEQPNRNLDFMQSHHYVLAYNWKINDHLRFSAEPYYQHLTNVPVSPDSYVSTLNFGQELFFNEFLTNAGTGSNIGVDLTLERFMKNGIYYLVTASLFDSKYTAGDGIERNTRFNRNYVLNALAGKEWMVGKKDNNLLSANIRLNYLGGNRIEPVDRVASLDRREVVYGETQGNLAFGEQFDDQPVVSFTVSYRINKPQHSSEWSLKVLNVMGTEEFDTDYYNLRSNAIDTQYTGIMVPNLSYKIIF